MLRLLACIAFFPASSWAELSPTRVDKPPTIDGVLSPGEWAGVATVSELIQRRPKEGPPVSEKTTVFFAYDEKNLYVAFDARDSNPEGIRANLSRRGSIGSDDQVYVTLDTFADQRTAFEFGTNPLGVQWDGFISHGQWDSSFNTQWKSEGRVDDGGFVVEMAIPFKGLRYPDAEVQNWRIQAHRIIERKDELATWPAFSPDRGGSLSQMASLEGMRLAKPGPNFEAIPEFSLLKSKNNDTKGEAGLSLKYSPFTQATLDATVNPDFSQVELDPVRLVTNLRFPVFIGERRPFFLERADVFSTPIQVIHTRTIVDPLWGVKTSGKTGRSNFSLLGAEDQATGKAKTFLGRVALDFGEENAIGAIGTVRESDTESNAVSGIDTRFRWSEIYSGRAQGVFSRTIQNGDSKLGSAAVLALFRTTRESTLSFGSDHYSPDYVASSGFVSRKDFRDYRGSWERRFYVEKPRLTFWAPSVSYSRRFDWAGRLVDENYNLQLRTNAPTWTAQLGVLPQNLERFQSQDFRKDSVSLSGSYTPSSELSASAGVTYGDGIHFSAPVVLGTQKRFDASVTLRPWKRLRSSSQLVLSELSRRDPEALLSEQTTLRETLRFQLTREASLRAIVDWTKVRTPATTTRTVVASFLGTYLLTPGTALYAGYDVTRTKAGSSPYATSAESAVFKATYHFRP